MDANGRSSAIQCLSDAEWERVAALFEQEGGRGTPPRHTRRELLDAYCYAVRTGCSWRMLPKEIPHWDNAYKAFRRWSAQGKFEQMHDRLRDLWRQREARHSEPTAAILDARSTRVSPQGDPSGYDAGKKIIRTQAQPGGRYAGPAAGGERHDRRCAGSRCSARSGRPCGVQYPGVEKLYVDSAYAGQWAQQVYQTHTITVEVVRHPANRNVGRWPTGGQGELFPVQARQDGFVVLPKRWVVERTRAWNERAIMHHDRLPQVSEAWVWLTEARLLLRRLTA